MSVVEVWTPDGTARIEGQGYEPTGQMETRTDDGEDDTPPLALVAARCSRVTRTCRDGVWTAVGDPMDAAVDVARPAGRGRRGGRPGGSSGGGAVPLRSDGVAGCRSRTRDRLFVKGAADSMLGRCRRDPARGRGDRGVGRSGLRVIAVGTRRPRQRPRDAGDGRARSGAPRAHRAPRSAPRWRSQTPLHEMPPGGHPDRDGDRGSSRDGERRWLERVGLARRRTILS